jgi:subtilisin family serine protease
MKESRGVSGVKLAVPVVAILVWALLVSPAGAVAAEKPDQAIVPNQYIVLFKSSVDHPGELARSQTQNRGGSVGFVYHDLNGFSGELTPAVVEALRKDPRVASVEPNVRGGVAAQATPTGIKRIFATTNEALDIDEKDDVRVNANVAVVDTGIDYKHPDLNVGGRTDCSGEAKKATECINESGTDGYGHGTHVAGTIGAIDNGEGVVGVAPGVRLWGVKVLDSSGGGTLGEFIAGVEWITATRKDANPENDIEVANASLRYFTTSSEATSKALKESVEAGVVWVVAAGNESEPVQYIPGIDPNVITVSALTDYDGIPGGKGSPTCINWGEDDKLAAFSNYGKDVEIIAPGVCIYSTWKNGTYAFDSGTSMASPHVAGAAAVLAAKSIPKSMKDVEAIRSTLIKDGKTAETEGGSNWTDTSGDGIQEPLLYAGGFPPPLATTEAATSITQLEATLNATVNPKGFKTTYQFEYGKTTFYGKLVPVPAKEVGSGTEGVKVSEKLSLAAQKASLEPNATYHFRVVATNAGGTTKGEDLTFTTPRAVNPPTFSLSFGEAGTGNGQFTGPSDLAIDPEGNIWVSEESGSRVQKFNSKGEFLLKFGTKGKEDGQFTNLHGVTVDPSGNVWTVESSRVQKFNSKGEFLLKFGSSGSGNGQFAIASGITSDPAGNIWTSEVGSTNRVQKFNSKGEFLLKAGGTGSGDGQFKQPYGVSSDKEGNIWVGDSTNARLQKLDSKGRFLDKYGEAGTGDGKFTAAGDVGVDSQGNLWALDQTRVQEIYPEGEYVTKFGEAGSGKGQFSTMLTGIEADAAGNLWIVDRGNSRIQKWAPGTAYPVTTTAASSTGRTTATLNGLINPQGKATSYQFEWGTTQAFGATVPVPAKSIGSGSSAVKVSELLSGLKAGTTYYYHVLAISEAGTTYGETRHFRTQAPAGAEAKWRIGDKTLAELGLEKATFSSSGTMTIDIPGWNSTFKCTETTTGGEISGTNGVKETITLTGCKLLQAEQCIVEPVYLPTVSGTVGSLTSKETFLLETKGAGCAFWKKTFMSTPNFSLEVGLEGLSLPINTSGETLAGANPVIVTGVSTWWLNAEQIGKTLGYW